MDDLSSQPSEKSYKRSNHQWSQLEDKVLVECMLELVNRGWKADNGFKTGYLMQLQKWMAEKIKDCRIKGWDDATKTVTCEDYVWNNWVKGHKEAAGLRNKPFPYYDDLAIIFGKDQANGEGAESPGEAVEAVDKEETMKNTAQDEFFGVDIELESLNESVFVSENLHSESSSGASKRKGRQMGDESTLCMRKGKKKKGSPVEPVDEAFLAQMEKITTICDATRGEISKVGAYFDNINAKLQSRALLYDMVTKIDGLTTEEAIQAYGIVSADKGKSESFLMIPNDEAKLIYLKGVLSGLI